MTFHYAQGGTGCNWGEGGWHFFICGKSLIHWSQWEKIFICRTMVWMKGIPVGFISTDVVAKTISFRDLKTHSRRGPSSHVFWVWKSLTVTAKPCQAPSEGRPVTNETRCEPKPYEKTKDRAELEYTRSYLLITEAFDFFFNFILKLVDFRMWVFTSEGYGIYVYVINWLRNL